MIITIDRAGRVVIPKSVRDHFHLVPGAEVELTTDSESIKLSLRDAKPTLIRKDGLLVHTGSSTAPLDLDIAGFIAQGREGRSRDLIR